MLLSDTEMNSCNVCGSTEFKRTADDVYICLNGHMNKEMLIMETEFEGFNTQTLTQSQQFSQAQPIKESKALFGQEELLMMIDAIQYCLVQYTEQVQSLTNVNMMRCVYELWINWLIKHNVKEEYQDLNGSSNIKMSDTLGIIWIACQMNRLPISFHNLLDFLTPVILPYRYKNYISKNQLKHLTIKLTTNRENLRLMLDYFDYIHLPAPNIQIYACYFLQDLKLPLSIAETWYELYNTNYWPTASTHYRITFDTHVIWSLYFYIKYLFSNNIISFDLISWICQWYKHLSICNVPPKNSRLALFLHNSQNTPLNINLMRKMPVFSQNEFYDTTHLDAGNVNFNDYCREGMKKIPSNLPTLNKCNCFKMKYTNIDSEQFSILLQHLFVYFSPLFDNNTVNIKKAEERYFEALLAKQSLQK